MTYEQLLERLKTDMQPAPSFLNSYMGIAFALVLALLLIVAIIWGLSALGAVYSVWRAHKQGQAELAQAKNEQQIQTAKAQGRLSAADLNKQAEIIDASAVAKSVEIIGTALHNNEGYMRWQWIRMMEQKDAGDVIYVPTEANLPILEAGARLKSVKPAAPVGEDEDES